MKSKHGTTGSKFDDLLHLVDTCMPDAERRQIEIHTLDGDGGSCFHAGEIDPDFAVICSGWKEVSKGYNMRFRNYPFHRLVYTLSGSASIESPGGTRTCTAGSIYGLAPKKLCDISCTSDVPWKHLYVHYAGREAGELHKRIFRGTSVIHTVHPARIQTLFENIAFECIERADHHQAICNAYLRALLLKLSGENEKQDHLSPAKKKFLQCRDYIEQNFEEIVTISQIAEKCHISNGYLCRLFKKHAGTTPLAYAAKRKMERATWLLINTDFAIKKISLILRFDNQYYFSKVFKKAFGESPTRYRHNHWKEAAKKG